jgi:2,3,4,5-tetrahydropyridine-2,6-dicarboxylate N-succinyltransferase (EC 2.3.1.117)
MTREALQTTIEAAWEARDGVSPQTKGEIRDAVEAALEGLDRGAFRVAKKIGGGWNVHQWLKKGGAAVVSASTDMVTVSGGPGGAPWFDSAV